MIRDRFVIIRRMDMADRFWRLALCWICIVGLAAANGERFKPNTFKANHVIVIPVITVILIQNSKHARENIRKYICRRNFKSSTGASCCLRLIIAFYGNQ